MSFNKKAWLKPGTDINKELRKNPKNDNKKNFFKLMNNSIFGKTIGNVRSHRDVKLISTKRRITYFL